MERELLVSTGNPRVTIVAFGLLLIVGGLSSCSSQPSKATPQPTPEQVRSNADRTFDKLKQEERERGGGAQAPLR
ncbi:MAG: hypothetical protein ACT4OO_08550 [Nitrospiraceae bacterium]